MGLAIGTGVQNGRVGHQVAHVAHKQQRAAMQLHLTVALGRVVDAVGIQAALEGCAAFADVLGQCALQNTQPVAVRQELVFGVHRGHGIFQVEDGGQGGFHYQIADMRRVGGTNGVLGVDLDVQMQAVVDQQNRAGVGCVALVTDKLLGVGQGRCFATLEGDDQRAFDHGVADRVDV